MPRNTRNFWLTAKVDGRKTWINTGPPAKDGGFSLNVYQRSGGAVTRAFVITGWVRPDGSLSCSIEDDYGRPIVNHITTR